MKYRTSNRHSIRFIVRRFARKMSTALREAYSDITASAQSALA